MSARRHEAHMSNDKRLTILETTILHVNDSLLDIKHELRRQSDRMDRLENKIETRFDAIDNKFETIDNKFDAIDKKFEIIDIKFTGLDKKFESIDQKFIGMDQKLESKFDTLNNRLWSNFLWLSSMMVGLAGLIAHTQHWI